MLTVKNLYKKWNNGKEIFNDLNIELDTGDCVAICGASGIGKSTFLRCLGLLSKPDRGSILLDGVDILKLEDKHKHTARQKISLVVQHPALFPQYNVLKNITLTPTHILYRPQYEVLKDAKHFLEALDCTGLINMFPKELSGGQKHRIAIVRALVMRPLLLLLDEPTSAIDRELIDKLKGLIFDLNKNNISVIFTTHDIEFAYKTAKRVLYLENGKLHESKSYIKFNK